MRGPISRCRILGERPGIGHDHVGFFQELALLRRGLQDILALCSQLVQVASFSKIINFSTSPCLSSSKAIDAPMSQSIGICSSLSTIPALTDGTQGASSTVSARPGAPKHRPGAG
jgi:hypothetical protein